MRNLATLALVVALLASACAGDGGDMTTTTVPSSTGTAATSIDPSTAASTTSAAVPLTTSPVPPPSTPATSSTTMTTTTIPPETAAHHLLCRDLVAAGDDYGAAVDYWAAKGRPARMDADGDGIPCETVYPKSTVRAYWKVSEGSVNEAVAAALVAARRNPQGVTFCGHRMRVMEVDLPAVTAFVEGTCEAYGGEDGRLALLTGRGIAARVDLVLDDGDLFLDEIEFAPEDEDDPTTIFPPGVPPVSHNTPLYPDDPLLQAVRLFGATQKLSLGSDATCEEIAAFGYPDYYRAVAYWLRQGRPSSLDANGDGRPCESAFDAADVDRFWNEASVEFSSHLFCRDLDDRGLNFEEAVAYWLTVGAPDRMDADRNGIPCETVYPAASIEAFLAPARPHSAGLFCRDVEAADATFAEAVAYWLLEGAPSRMDADRNGVPCETVFDRWTVESFIAQSQEAASPLEPDLFCRDLFADGRSFRQAVQYWLQHGSPSRMDADRNGIPCETVYPAYSITELLEFDRIFRVPSADREWQLSATSWPGIIPGCCGYADVGPLSPTDPWPTVGWPSDGFYPVVESEAAWDVGDSHRPLPAPVASYDLTMYRSVPTQSGDGVTIDDAAPPLRRHLQLTEDLTVVIRPGSVNGTSPDALVGNGNGFRLLVADLHDYGLGGPGESIDDFYIGPKDARISIGVRWYFYLEIRNGEPILYLFAGYVAG